MTFLVSYYPIRVKPMILSKFKKQMHNKNHLIMILINKLYQIIVVDEVLPLDYFLKLNFPLNKTRKLLKLKINFFKFRKSKKYLVSKNK